MKKAKITSSVNTQGDIIFSCKIRNTTMQSKQKCLVEKFRDNPMIEDSSKAMEEFYSNNNRSKYKYNE